MCVLRSIRSRRLLVVLIAIAAFIVSGIPATSSVGAQSYPRSQRVALVPNASGEEDHGGAFPTSGFPDVYSPSFDTVSPAAIRDDASDPLLNGYDTVVLNSICAIGSYLANATFKERLEGFVSRGGKLIIWDSECTSTDYSNFALPFKTNNPGQLGAQGTLVDVEENTLSSSDPSKSQWVNLSALAAQTDAVGDANVFTTFDPRWYVDLRATNAAGVDGPVHAYAQLGAGLIIYSGLDKDNMGPGSFDPSSTNGADHLRRVWLLELLQPWSPDGLPNSHPVIGKSLRYVALGDSYSSGEGAGAGKYFQWQETRWNCSRNTFFWGRVTLNNLGQSLPGWDCAPVQVGHDIACHRAPTAWSFPLAKLSSDIDDNVENTACTGATISRNLLKVPKDNEQPQVKRLAELDAQKQVDLVTFTISGNDIDFGGIVRDCYLQWGCKNEATKVSNRLNRLDLVEPIRQLAKSAPHATIAYVSYPQAVPASQNDVSGCGWLKGSVREDLRSVVGNINLAEYNAVQQAKREGIRAEFIDISNALAGHELCTSNSHMVRIYGNPRNSEQAHPNTDGQNDIAASVFNGMKKLGIVLR